MAGMFALTTGLTLAPMTMPPAVMADTEVDDASLSPFERRRLELERRRELLREAREKAEALDAELYAKKAALASGADAAVEDANEARRQETEKRAASLRALSAKTYEEQASKSVQAPPPNPLENSPLNFELPKLPEKLSDIKAPSLDSFTAPKVDMPKFNAPNFSFPSFSSKEDEEEKPAPPAPAPAPRYVAPPPPPPPAPVRVAPVPVAAPKPEPAKPAPAPAQAKPGKRKGPLPLFLAEVLVLGSFAGVFYVALNYQKEAAAAIAQATGLVAGLYNKAEEAVKKASAK